MTAALKVPGEASRKAARKSAGEIGCRNLGLGALAGAICSATLGLAGCSGTAVTLNDQPVHTPTPLLVLENIPDRNLVGCIEQTLADQRIRTLDQLRTLVCSSAGIESLAGLEQLKQLRQLDLHDNALTRIEAVFDLRKLVYLNVEGNPRLSCADLKMLESLRGEDLEVRAPAHCG